MKHLLFMWLTIALILLLSFQFSFSTTAYDNLERGKSSTHLAIEHTSKPVKLSREVIVVQIKRRIRTSRANTTSSSSSSPSAVHEKSSLLVQACFGINFSVLFAFFFL
ncbi:hypothetical protein ACP275_10G133700 [Erythranthe tilingii]